MNPSKTEKDLENLIDCLTGLTRELQATRTPAPNASTRRRRSSSRRKRPVPTGSPFYPKGNPLTESMEFTDRDGRGWLVYIEGSRRAPPKRQSRVVTVLPDRHLRFDSASESRFTTVVPAGSPFLAETRLQSLLDEAESQVPSAGTTSSSAGSPSDAEHRKKDWSARAVESGREAVADWSRRWQQTAGRGKALGSQVLGLMSEAASSMREMVETSHGSSARPAIGWPIASGSDDG